MGYQSWALLSALFAGLTALWAKKGVEDVPPNFALAFRVLVVVVVAFGIAVATKQVKFQTLTPRAMTFLTLSGLATGASWLCYFRALKLGPISRVAPIDKLSFVIAMALGFLFLKEKPSLNLVIGAVMICGGVLVTLR